MSVSPINDDDYIAPENILPELPSLLRAIAALKNQMNSGTTDMKRFVRRRITKLIQTLEPGPAVPGPKVSEGIHGRRHFETQYDVTYEEIPPIGTRSGKARVPNLADHTNNEDDREAVAVSRKRPIAPVQPKSRKTRWVRAPVCASKEKQIHSSLTNACVPPAAREFHSIFEPSYAVLRQAEGSMEIREKAKKTVLMAYPSATVTQQQRNPNRNNSLAVGVGNEQRRQNLVNISLHQLNSIAPVVPRDGTHCVSTSTTATLGKANTQSSSHNALFPSLPDSARKGQPLRARYFRDYENKPHLKD